MGEINKRYQGNITFHNSLLEYIRKTLNKWQTYIIKILIYWRKKIKKSLEDGAEFHVKGSVGLILWK